MGLSDAIQKSTALITNLGKGALNIMFPNEFEVYMCALELQAQNGRTLQYFIFPVMPSSIDETIPKITNIKKTAQGVVVLSSSSFIPTDINLVGSFGRKFRILLGKTPTELVSAFQSSVGSITQEKLPAEFNVNVKTGYGCIKILQTMISSLDTIDTYGVKKLILYNLALGNNYIVEPLALRFSQSEQSNMIWNYSLQLKSVMPLDAYMTDQDLRDQRARLALLGVTQTVVNKSLVNINSLINQGINNNGAKNTTSTNYNSFIKTLRL